MLKNGGMKVRAECQFAKAGQGLFYNGLLVNQKGSSFSFVYDCGTSASDKVLSNSLLEYKEISDKRLDLLSISHFHKDHVSHIPELLDGLELGTVIIPFVKPELRLLLAAQYDDIETDDERIRLYNNPVIYFLSHGAESVLVGVSSENEDFDFWGEPNSNFSQEGDDSQDNPNHIFVIGNNATDTTSFFESKAVEYSGCFSVISRSYQWEFRFKNMHDDRMHGDFGDEITKLLEKHDNRFDEILRNKSYTKQLRKIYEDNFRGGINDTSLILLSQPLIKGWLVGNCSCYDVLKDCTNCSDECQKNWRKLGHAASLLLGDLSINHRMLDHYFHRINTHLPQLPRVIQLPHHGAKMKNHPFKCEICHFYKHKCHFPSSFVASYGIKNRYGHPDMSYCINCHRCDLHWKNVNIELVNERKDFSYTISF